MATSPLEYVCMCGKFGSGVEEGGLGEVLSWNHVICSVGALSDVISFTYASLLPYFMDFTFNLSLRSSAVCFAV